jgi:hypothetical protein
MGMKKLFFLYAALILSACNKLIKVPSNAGGQVVTSQVFTDSANATAGVLGLYAANTLVFQLPEQYSGLSGDELDYNATSVPYTEFYHDSLTEGNNGTVAASASQLWTYYGTQSIYLANAAIEGLNADNLISTSLAGQLIGECEVVRAFYYFLLVNFFGPVPIVTSSDFAVTEKLGRAPVDSVYGQIEKDLLDAQSKMSAAYPSAGRQRSNRYTALALLARVYLYRKQWSQASAMADSIISSGLYSLTSFDNVFLDGSTEAIWQIGPSNTLRPEAPPGGAVFLPILPPPFPIVPTYSMTAVQMAAFEPGDLRKSQWVYMDVVNGTTYYYPYKYKNSGTSNASPGQEDLMVFRLAEIYLIRAEARAYLGDLAGAASDVNVVRTRAGLGPATFNTFQAAITGILHERQTELFCEWGHRWFDLIRNDSINAVLTREKPQYWAPDGHDALYPIPLTEILYNSNLTQNPGY